MGMSCFPFLFSSLKPTGDAHFYKENETFQFSPLSIFNMGLPLRNILSLQIWGSSIINEVYIIKYEDFGSFLRIENGLNLF